MENSNSQKSSPSVEAVVRAHANRLISSYKIMIYDAYELGYMKAVEELRKLDPTRADMVEEIWNSGKAE